MYKTQICLIFVLLLLLTSASFAAQPDYVYVSATNVRIRDAASTSGKVVATLPIGTWGKVIETSEKTDNLLGKTAHWYKISIDNDQQGWIFGGLTLAATAEDRFSAAIQIIDSQVNTENKSLEDLMQTLEFAENVKELASHSLEKAELEMAFLVVLGRVYSSLSMSGKGDITSHKAVKDYKNLCYYHEMAGQYFIQPKTFWDLAEKYADITEASEKIAWAAANQTIGGETEGDLDLMIEAFEMTHGRYIESYPEGKHVAQALGIAAYGIDHISDNLSYYESAEDKEKLKNKLEWFEDLAAITPASESRKKLTASIKKVRDRLGN